MQHCFGDDRDCALCAGQRSEKDPSWTDGLGTEATRAGIIELLFKLVSSPKKGAISTPPTPEKRYPFAARNGYATGHDRALGIGATQISEKQCRYQDFMQPLVGSYISLLIKPNVLRCGSFAALGSGQWWQC